MEAIEGKVSIATLSNCQPSHLSEIARHFRRVSGKVWDEGVRCSWVDMAKRKAQLSAGRRGDQKALEKMVCVGASTVSKWKLTCDIIGAIDGKVSLTTLSVFQPTHAEVLSRHFRREHGDTWDESVREEIAEWVERCEAEEWTVKHLRDVLHATRASNTPPLPEGTFRCIMAELVWGKAQHRLGEVLRVTVNHKGGGDRKSPQHGVRVIHADNPKEITPMQSSRAQQLAEVSWPEIEQRILEARTKVHLGAVAKAVRADWSRA
jgi:hypothetical protein